jgi:inorganic pyrophosphatase
MSYFTHPINHPDSPDYKLYVMKDPYTGTIISPFHDIPLYADKKVCRIILEIPKHTTKKIEINKNEPMNPLTYNLINGNIRTVEYKAIGCVKKGYPYNYGALPQTWEDSTMLDYHIGKYGDNDPIDVFDISDISQHTGNIYNVKILGAYSLIDSNQTDWKIIAINILDPLANMYNDILDVPAEVRQTIEDFLINYKSQNQTSFFNQKIWSASETMQVIESSHQLWKNLVSNKSELVNIAKHISNQTYNNITNIYLHPKEYQILI